MNINPKGIKVGDLVTAAPRGYWRVTGIRRLFVDQGHLDEYQKYHDPKIQVGDEIFGEVLLELCLTSTLQPPRGKKPVTSACNMSYCEKVDKAWVMSQARLAADGWTRLKALV